MNWEAVAALPETSLVVGVLLGDRAVDGFEHRADRLDRLRDAMHRVGGAGGVLLERVDLLGDLFGRALGLHRQRLDLGGDDRKAFAGGTRARCLDGRVEREQRGLPRDLRDQMDDVADGRGGLPQAVDIGARFLRCGAGLVGELAGLADLRADALRRLRELVGGMGEGVGGRLGGVGTPGERVGALADGRERGRGRFRAAGHRVGGALELANHAAKLKFQKFQDFLGRIALGGRGGLGSAADCASLRCDRRRGRIPADVSEIIRMPSGLSCRGTGGRYFRRPE